MGTPDDAMHLHCYWVILVPERLLCLSPGDGHTSKCSPIAANATGV
uniref:Uncharacterized protein n=1 Tax=Anguilla anguilla TaxID=7936 RepID=A0A0E9PMH4_ANGAN